MPLPMIHLAVSIEISKMENLPPASQFLLGSIAPDAIHMRPGAGSAEKRVTHLADLDDPENIRVRQMLQQLDSNNGWGHEFIKGYAIHLLTDRFWEKMIGEPFRSSLPQDISPQERRKLYYDETDQIDFDLYHQAPWRDEVWEKLASCQTHDFAGLLSAEEISRWRDRTINWFEKLKAEPGIVPVHITRTMAENFVKQAAQDIQILLQQWDAS